LDAGIRAVISTQIADIFRNNALKNGLLPITIDAPTHQRLLALRDAVTIDLAEQRVTLTDGTSAAFAIDPFAKHCILHGINQLGFLLAELPAIDRYESTHPARVTTRAT